jgi:linoleoyl-CoA desaturase
MRSSHVTETPEVLGPAEPESLRLQRFGEAIDAIRVEVESQLGEADVRNLRRLDAFSRVLELTGRLLIHFSLEPVSFVVGVLSLAIFKELQAAEIGHPVLHGAYDRLPGAEAFRSRAFSWDVPIDEESWREGHNVRHHQYTNIAGRDPDIHFGGVRLTEQTPHRWGDWLRTPIHLLVAFPSFTLTMNAHFTGLLDLYFGNGRAEEFDFLPDRSWRSALLAHRRALRKALPYYAKNYLLFPLLAGPFFWKVLLGNWLAETLRDVYLAATIYCGHVGADVSAYPEGARAHGRGEWYAMQVEAANNFEVSWPISVLCGALDRQIEHHLFPKLPPERLRQISSQVREACAAHGVRYRTDSWGRTLRRALAHVLALSRGTTAGVLREVA